MLFVCLFVCLDCCLICCKKYANTKEFKKGFAHKAWKEDHGLFFFKAIFFIKIMSHVPKTKLSDQWEKKVEHVSNLII